MRYYYDYSFPIGNLTIEEDGHGICGMSRLSKRSIVATMSFMFAGFVTVYIVRHVTGAF